MQQLKGKLAVLCDVIIAVIAVVMMICSGTRYLTLNKQGFYCDDKSISYPQTDGSLKGYSIFAIVLPVPAIVILIVEVLVSLGTGTPERPLRMRGRRALHVFVAYFYGFACALGFTLILKSFVIELRPNFLDICKPDFSKINCSAGYITEYNCTSGLSRAVLEDASTSFPSGHSATMFSMATFLILYLHKTLDGRPTPLTVSMVHLVLIVFATVTSIRRISEHQHHWWDIVFGVLIGIATGAYAFYVFLSKADSTIATVNLSPPKPLDDNVEDTSHINGSEMRKINM